MPVFLDNVVITRPDTAAWAPHSTGFVSSPLSGRSNAREISRRAAERLGKRSASRGH